MHGDKVDGLNMGRVLVKLRVMPAQASVAMDKLEREIKARLNPDKIEREPIAFGLVALELTKIVEDREKVVEEMETRLMSIEGVGSVEVVEVSRVIG